MDDYTADIAPDPDIDAVIEALANCYAAQTALRPVLIRMEERRRARIAVRASRAKRSASPRERRSA
jgi:hypothetical protein